MAIRTLGQGRGLTRRAHHFIIGALLSDGTLAGAVASAAATAGTATGLLFEPQADNEPQLVAMPKIIWRQAVTSGTAEGCTSCLRPMPR